jgi:hypothetical protein
MMEFVLEDEAVKMAAEPNVESAGETARDVHAIVLGILGHGTSSDDQAVTVCEEHLIVMQ